MKCKDCIKYDVCEWYDYVDVQTYSPENCRFFKNKDEYVKVAQDQKMPTRSEQRRINVQQGRPVNEGLEPTVTELKPCPFCGSKAKHFVFCEGEYDETKLRHNIQCLNEAHNCFASVGRDWVLGYNTEKEAIEAWNRRNNNG